MLDNAYLLSDQEIRYFIVNGYIKVKTDLPASFHQTVLEQTETVFAKEGNPGNNLLPRIPEIRKIFDSKTVRGALTSLLGEDYYLQPHRHCHYNSPKSEGQNLHQDGGAIWSHHTRRLLVFYYPQDTPDELGPTGIVPGSHYYNTPAGGEISEELPLCGEAGTIAIANYDLWHRARPNLSDKKRYMMKFLSARMSEPKSPSWNSEQTEWSDDYGGRQNGPIHEKHQRMFKHLWDWHYGKASADVAKIPPTSGESTSELIEALGSDSESLGLNAAYRLGGLGSSAVPPLIEKLGHESETIRRNACYALSALGTLAVDGLIRALEDREWQVRDRAAETLGDIGLPAQGALPGLIDALSDGSEQVRYHAAEALGIVGQSESTAVSALTWALSDKEEKVRGNATFALARIGPYAKDAVDGLGAVLYDENRYVRGDAAHALHRIATPEAKDVLLSRCQEVC